MARARHVWLPMRGGESLRPGEQVRIGCGAYRPKHLAIFAHAEDGNCPEKLAAAVYSVQSDRVLAECAAVLILGIGFVGPGNGAHTGPRRVEQHVEVLVRIERSSERPGQGRRIVLEKLL